MVAKLGVACCVIVNNRCMNARGMVSYAGSISGFQKCPIIIPAYSSSAGAFGSYPLALHYLVGNGYEISAIKQIRHVLWKIQLLRG